MKKNVKKTVLILIMPILFMAFIGKLLLTLFAIYFEEKNEKLRIY